MQAYASIADVYRLYGTLLKNPEWDKFEFIGQWHQLSDEQKRSKYNEFACHELNFFLYNKDRTFFDRVIKPLLEQKLEKQIVDRWLLGQPLDAFDPLWRTQKLNTLERILLAKSLVARQPGTAKWLQDFVDAFPVAAQERAERFEVALRGMALDDRLGMVAQRLNEDYFLEEKMQDSAGQAMLGIGKDMGGGMGGGMEVQWVDTAPSKQTPEAWEVWREARVPLMAPQPMLPVAHEDWIVAKLAAAILHSN